MEHYTIEDIEVIRRKSGISYQEAVALLEYHEGNVARALVDLERNGKIRPEGEQGGETKQESGNKDWLSGLMGKLYRCRVKIRKGEIQIANVSLIFTAAAVLISPRLALLSCALCLLFGYSVRLDKCDAGFETENLERMVKNAAQNVKNSMGDIARSFGHAAGDREKESAPSPGEKQEKADEERSYYRANPAATTAPTRYTGHAPVLQVPDEKENTGSGAAKTEKKEWL